jgi:hypothetical protein
MTMTTMTTGGAAGDTVAGTAIPRAIRRLRARAGKSEAALAPAIATKMTIVGIRARARATTTTIGAAAAGMAAGTAIRKGIPKRRGVAGGNCRSG